MKDKKLLYLRQPHGSHAAKTKWGRRWLATRLTTGMYSEPNVKLRSTLGGRYRVVNYSISEVLPWLYLGKVETDQNEDFLTQHKFTHILNVTDSVSQSATPFPV